MRPSMISPTFWLTLAAFVALVAAAPVTETSGQGRAGNDSGKRRVEQEQNHVNLLGRYCVTEYENRGSRLHCRMLSPLQCRFELIVI